jgi:hypothetical protein
VNVSAKDLGTGRSQAIPRDGRQRSHSEDQIRKALLRRRVETRTPTGAGAKLVRAAQSRRRLWSKLDPNRTLADYAEHIVGEERTALEHRRVERAKAALHRPDRRGQSPRRRRRADPPSRRQDDREALLETPRRAASGSSVRSADDGCGPGPGSPSALPPTVVSA